MQRGNNRQNCFRERSDYLRYLGYLANSARRYEVEIHAYVLMANHVHLLFTPSTENGASRMMQNLGRSYVRAFNEAYDRTGTLWEGRFRSYPVPTERYLFACYRYIELNPVKAGIVKSPDDYPWSSFRTNALGATNVIITPRQEWIDLGGTAGERCDAYRRMFKTALDECVLAEIEASIKSGSEPALTPVGLR